MVRGKDVPSRADTHTMSKRALLQLLGCVATGLTYLVAAGASGGVPASVSECVGLTSLRHWLESSCEPVLVPRLFIVGIGAIPIILLFYFAERSKPTLQYHEIWEDKAKGLYWCEHCKFRSNSTAEARVHGRLLLVTPSNTYSNPNAVDRWLSVRGTSFHRVMVQEEDEDDPALYWCQDCEFESEDAQEADRHSERRSRPGPIATTLPPKAYGFGSVPPTTALTAAIEAAGGKTCPDCAEQVQAAARKCRFCGYRFDQDVEADARRT